MPRGQRLTGTALPLLFCIQWADPAPNGTLAKVHFFADLANVRALDFDYLSYLEFEAGVKGSSGSMPVHFYCHFGLKNLSRLFIDFCDTPLPLLSRLKFAHIDAVGSLTSRATQMSWFI